MFLNQPTIIFISPEAYVIGLIEIPQINLKYPILSTINDDLLKISPCKFHGAMPNEIGNMCIAAHNYDNNTFFSNIDSLNINDIIYIHDLYGYKCEYSVYQKYEVPPTDISCINGSPFDTEITLITCNNITGNRIIVKAYKL